MTHHKTLSAKYLIVTCCCLLETRGIVHILIFKITTNFFFSLQIFDTDYTPMQRRSADIALQTPLQKRLTSTLNDVLYWKEEGGEIFHALIVWFWDFLGTQWGDIFFQKAFLFPRKIETRNARWWRHSTAMASCYYFFGGTVVIR